MRRPSSLRATQPPRLLETLFLTRGLTGRRSGSREGLVVGFESDLAAPRTPHTGLFLTFLWVPARFTPVPADPSQVQTQCHRQQEPMRDGVIRVPFSIVVAPWASYRATRLGRCGNSCTLLARGESHHVPSSGMPTPRFVPAGPAPGGFHAPLVVIDFGDGHAVFACFKPKGRSIRAGATFFVLVCSAAVKTPLGRARAPSPRIVRCRARSRASATATVDLRGATG